MSLVPDPSPALAAYAHPERLVTTQWLAEHLDDPGVVVVESDEDVLLYDPTYQWPQNPAYFDYPYGGFGGGLPGLLKPDVATYTNTVDTTTFSGLYAPFSGTSAATPQLGGGLMLLRHAQPEALPRHVAAAVELSAQDLGPIGKDVRFGAGKLQVFEAARLLFREKIALGKRRVRLLGVAVSNLLDERLAQLELFDDESAGHDQAARLAKIEDAVRSRVGDGAITRGRLVRRRRG